MNLVDWIQSTRKGNSRATLSSSLFEIQIVLCIIKKSQVQLEPPKLEPAVRRQTLQSIFPQNNRIFSVDDLA